MRSLDSHLFVLGFLQGGDIEGYQLGPRNAPAKSSSNPSGAERLRSRSFSRTIARFLALYLRVPALLMLVAIRLYAGRFTGPATQPR